MARKPPAAQTAPNKPVSFDISAADAALVRKIARRARELLLTVRIDIPALDMSMDLTATHANGCPMDFERLAAADDFNLMHDVGGIARHLDRKTGKLAGGFLPRFHRRDSEAAQ
ncbi:hypothetical protein ACQR1I_35965 [Bradyrhizobium sp. HKCCYLS2038]|uniref:DUF6874 family protein n=1 Tax=Bradyrhizobium sp. HKCCYLS2038 TaxID=3420764 RepID=UPI003EB9FB54